MALNRGACSANNWNGRHYAIDTQWPAVKTPAAAIGNLRVVDPEHHYEAPGWRGDAARLRY